ncbi:MAG: DNA polymerase III subunit delta [Candidatus Moranbacteria bacterium RIFCSPHIGHO2_01_FULL_55_24]|nr:MAG: DNA polymerase III subunit delta [Candidatus Moranbacteria bacterium RIFCSPHIGHO2_01_FULL_55_24]
MIRFISGNDLFLLGRRRRELQEAFLASSPEAELFVFDFEDQGRPEDVNRFFQACEAGLFAAPKMLIAFHPLALAAEAGERLEKFLETAALTERDDVTLLFIEPGNPKKSDPLMKWFAKHAQSEVLAALEERGQEKLVLEELARLGSGARFSREGLRLFLARAGKDTANLCTELEKLALYRAGEEIRPADVELMVGSDKEDTVFQALDALARGDRGTALLLFRNAAENKEGVLPLLALCAWQLRQFMMVREASDSGLRESGQIAKQTGISPFVAGKALRVTGEFPLARTRRGLRMLAEADQEIKRGDTDSLLALDLFISRL